MKILITHPLAPYPSYEGKGNIKILSKIIWFLFIVLPFSVYSEISICDNANISSTWSTVTEICNGWTKITNISWISSFTGSYQNIPTGYWWAEYTYSLSEIIYSMNTGYIGNKFWDESWQKTITKTSYNTPVWFFSTYKNTSLFFPTLEEILYTAQKIYLTNTDSWSWWWSSADNQNICNKPEQIENIQGAIKNQEYADILELTWEAQAEDTKFKIIQSYPSSETFYVDQWNTTFERQDLEDGKSYHYFVVPYNDCWDGIYSDSIQVEYNKEVPTEPYLEIEWDKIYFKNTDILWEGEVDLKCSLYWEEIILLSDKSYIYQININHIEEPFECYATYYDINEELQKTQTVTNLPNKTYITEQEAWSILMSDATKTLENTYYYLRYQPSNYLSYEQLSLYLINIKANIIFTDSELSLAILKNLWLIRVEVNGTSQIKYEDFLEILPKIGDNFRQDIFTRITQDFELTESKVYADTLKSYIIQTELKKEDSFSQEQLISCFIYEWCDNVELYNSFLERVNAIFMASEQEYKNLWIDVTSPQPSPFKGEGVAVTWKIYIEILFKVLWKEAFYEWGYSLSEYGEFVNVLGVGIVEGDNFYSQKIDFLSYNRFSLILQESDIFHKISFLTENYWEEIIDIYKDIDKREELFNILRDYLK